MAHAPSSAQDSGVKTTRTVFEILAFLEENDGAGISEIARELGFAKSTVHRHLSTLSELKCVVEEDDGYHIGLRFLELGEFALRRRVGYELAGEKVREIAENTGERVQFIVEEHGDAVYLHRSFGENAVRTDPGIGSRIPLHATAAGKAILANLPEDRLFEIIEQTPFDPLTENTITDRDALLSELETISERGYSFNIQENLEGLNAVGVPVMGRNEVIGALSISGPSHRLKGDRLKSALPDLLMGEANELELNISHA